MTMTTANADHQSTTPAASVLTKDISVVKIAVQRKSFLPQLINFNQSEPLAVIIKQLCSFWMIDDCENYALQFSDHTVCKYVTEKNRNDIKNGSILQLDFSVQKTVAEILRDLTEIGQGSAGDSANFEMLEKLLALSSDPVFASEFNANKGLNLMIEKIECSKLNDRQLALIIASFLELMEHGFVSWDSLGTDFLPILNSLLFTSSADKENSFKMIKATLQILENIVLNCGAENLQKSNSEVLAKSLQSLLDTLDFDDPKQIVIQQNILALLNALILRADDTQRRQIVRNFDLKPIQYILLNKGDSLGTEMAHQLSVLQQLILNFWFEDRMFRKIDLQDPDALERIRDLKRIAFESDICTFYSSDVSMSGGGGVGGGGGGGASNGGDRGSNGSGGSCGPSAVGNSSGSNRNKNTIGKDYRKLGFKNDLNPLLDFSETPPGILALDCMHYFALTYPEQYARIVLENSCRHDQYECPFGQTSIALVKVLGELFRIGEPANDQADHYYPVFFSHSRAFEQIFTIAISLLNKTWREMKATAEDFVKVFAVVREQLSRALQTKPRDLDAFRAVLKTLSYNEIVKLWQQERNSREEWESHAKPIVELKELIIPEILELIKRRRLNYLCEGTRFVKYTNRGQRIKDKFWFIKLSSNRKVFHYGDCNEIVVPTIEELPNKVTVADVRGLVTGKECPHMKDSKGRKATYQLAFALLLDATAIETDSNSQSLNFVAPSEQVYTYWTDGICALLNQPMTSKETESDLETLLSMEIKLRLLDVEGIDIPQEPPLVPPEPLNYDFYCV